MCLCSLKFGCATTAATFAVSYIVKINQPRNTIFTEIEAYHADKFDNFSWRLCLQRPEKKLNRCVPDAEHACNFSEDLDMEPELGLHFAPIDT